MKRPALITLLSLIAGRLVAELLPFPPFFIYLALIFLLAAQIWLFYKRKPGTFSRGGLLMVAVFLMGLYMGRDLSERDQKAAFDAELIAEEPYVTLTAYVADDPEPREGYVRLLVEGPCFVAETATRPVGMKVMLYLYGSAADKLRENPPARGDVVRVRGAALVPSSRRNPGLFDFRSYLASRGAQLIMRTRSASAVEFSPPGKGRSLTSRFLRSVYLVRRRAMNYFDEGYKPENAALLKGLVFGKSSAISDSDRELFLNAGLLHLLSVSGLHTGVVALCLFFLSRLAWLNFRLSAVITTVGLVLFAAFTGFRGPVVRAAIMGSCLLASYWLPGLRRKVEGLSLLTFAAFWSLVINPRALYRADFIFSYSCVFVIIVFMPFINEYLLFNVKKTGVSRKRLKFLANHYLLRPFWTVFILQLAILPLSAHYYHRVSLCSVFSNILMIPLAMTTLILAMLHLLAGMIAPPLSGAFSFVIAGFLELIRALAGLFQKIPYSSVAVRPLPWYVVGVYYAGLLGGNWILEKKERKLNRRVTFVLCCLALICLVIWLPVFSGERPELYMVFLDVGQGDCIYVEFPDGRNALIDAGRGYPADMGRRVVGPFLQRRGVNALSMAAATHPDADHVGGLSYILDKFFVEDFIESGADSDSDAWRAVERALDAWGVNRRVVVRGNRLEASDGAEIDILNPPEGKARVWSSNDASVVMMIRQNGAEILLTGDVSERVEKDMIQAGLDLQADVLKAAHHGSSTGTSGVFLNAVRPAAAVISAGRNNPYNHPHKEVLERLEKRDIRIFRTDESGAIILRVEDGEIYMGAMN